LAFCFCISNQILFTDAPARVKRGLSKVLALQNQIDAIELSIQEVRTTIATTGKETRESRQILDRLERTHQTLNEQAELLYTSLNLPGSFPELKGLPLKFVHHLTTMRALKVDIRDRAIGTLFEAEALGKTMTAREGPQGMYGSYRPWLVILSRPARDQIDPGHKEGDGEAPTRPPPRRR
jgi:hypothetical protein